MDVSIIIPNFNTKDLLDRCLISIKQSMHSTDISYEVIIVDNASTDGSVELIKNKHPAVVLICSKENLGYSRANNLALKRARGEYTLLLNSDTKILDSAIEKLLEFRKNHNRSFVGPKLLNEDLSAQASCGPHYTLSMLLFFLFLQGDRLGISRYSPNREQEVDWVSGASLLGKTSDFRDLGFFDEKIFMYMEELEFLYRAKQKGFRVFFYPEARVIHTGSASSGSRKEPVLNNYRGLLYFYHKHRSILEQYILKGMLIVKAYIVIVMAKLIGNQTLKKTYEEALRLV